MVKVKFTMEFTDEDSQYHQLADHSVIKHGVCELVMNALSEKATCKVLSMKVTRC